jgi:cell wall-associated NlpC family hydrolase
MKGMQLMRKVGSVLLVTLALTLSGSALDNGSSLVFGNLRPSNIVVIGNLLFNQKVAVAANTSNQKGKQYVVKKGDNLWAIAKRNSTTEAKLMSLNNLSSDLLQIGQVIYLEKQVTTSTSTKNTQERVEAEDQSISPNRGALDQVENILFTAKKYLGVPYVYGGQSPKGFDCSGFAQYVFNKFEIKLPRSSSQQAKVGTKVTRAQALPGDLIFFNTSGGKQISHVGIYLGGGKFIHASQNDGISITLLDSGYYANRLVTLRRILR